MNTTLVELSDMVREISNRLNSASVRLRTESIKADKEGKLLEELCLVLGRLKLNPRQWYLATTQGGTKCTSRDILVYNLLRGKPLLSGFLVGGDMSETFKELWTLFDTCTLLIREEGGSLQGLKGFKALSGDVYTSVDDFYMTPGCHGSIYTSKYHNNLSEKLKIDLAMCGFKASAASIEPIIDAMRIISDHHKILLEESLK